MCLKGLVEGMPSRRLAIELLAQGAELPGAACGWVGLEGWVWGGGLGEGGDVGTPVPRFPF